MPARHKSVRCVCFEHREIRVAMHYFFLGPSGVGKSTFADWVDTNRRNRHIPIDRGDDLDGLRAEGILREWVELKHGDPTAFVRALNERAIAAGKIGCVLTLWSIVFFDLSEMRKLAEHGIAVRYLYGPKEQRWAMCGRLRVGKKNLHVAGLVGAAMCSAFECGCIIGLPANLF
jgi:hypothetical protein